MKNENTLEGSVLYTVGSRALVIVNSKYYVLLDCDGAEAGTTVRFKAEESLPMPSYLFAVATMQEPDIGKALEEIRSHWFKDAKK